MAQLRAVQPSFGVTSKDAWLAHRAWQPLRKVVEQLLVTYDFGEAFIALDIVLKPAFDQVLHQGLGAAAAAGGDDLLRKLLFSLAEDASWHHAWSKALVEHLVTASNGNAVAVGDWIDRWSPRVSQALSALAQLELPHASFAQAIQASVQGIEKQAARFCKGTIR
jgi:toluene monooxygenase system protein E